MSEIEVDKIKFLNIQNKKIVQVLFAKKENENENLRMKMTKSSKFFIAKKSTDRDSPRS